MSRTLLVILQLTPKLETNHSARCWQCTCRAAGHLIFQWCCEHNNFVCGLMVLTLSQNAYYYIFFIMYLVQSGCYGMVHANYKQCTVCTCACEAAVDFYACWIICIFLWPLDLFSNQKATIASVNALGVWCGHAFLWELLEFCSFFCSCDHHCLLGLWRS